MIEQYNSQSSLVRPDSMLLPLQKVMRDAKETHAVPVFTGMNVDALLRPAAIAAFDTYFGRMAIVAGNRVEKDTNFYFAQAMVRPNPNELSQKGLITIPTLLLTVAQPLTFTEQSGTAYQAMKAKTRGFMLTEVMDARSGRKVVHNNETERSHAEDEYFEDLIYRLCGNYADIDGLKQTLAQLAEYYPAVPVTYYDLAASHFVGQELAALPNVQDSDLAKSA